MAVDGVRARRALTIGVTEFDRHARLDFAAGLVSELAAELEALGFNTRVHTANTLSSAELGTAVTDELDVDDADLLVVHVITHGHMGSDTVYALGSDHDPHRLVNVGQWMTSVQDQAARRPLTLFLLDLCSAGAAARLSWQVEDSDRLRAWVVAACGVDEDAYDGRFTRALITVLRALRAGELDVSPTNEFVPLATVARAIRQEVNRLAIEADVWGQQVTGSLVDISADPELPFFPNPAYTTSEQRKQQEDIDPALLQFVSDIQGLDAAHFVERASAQLIPTQAHGLVSYFSGRNRELRMLSPWLNGMGTGSVAVVTGSPGVGKSALLGVLVSAAHPVLRELTEPIWDRVAQTPYPMDSLVAVHARQRSTSDVFASLAEQLGLDRNASFPAAIAALDRTPVVVLDALDEADDPVRLMTEALLPLR